ncbi:MAG TPA: ABC transporter permease [Acidimicrobiia bacterium]|nr:ABC transporter permease [Acidimicrobiia bacterium]
MTMLAVPVRRGVSYWWQSYVAMLRWVLAQQKVLFATVLFIQLFMGLGSVAMYRFYIGDVDPVIATYLVSGLPALAIIPVGFVMVPILVMQEKFRGTFDFTWSLPVPRLAPVAATFTVFTAIALPIAAVTTWVAAWQFGASIVPSWAALGAAALASFVSTSVGYGMAMAIPEPRLTNLITNVVIFLVLLFSPIVIPIDRFPAWAEAVHRGLPFYHMANLIRAGLTDGFATAVGTSIAVLTAWAVAGWAMVAAVIGRRS